MVLQPCNTFVCAFQGTERWTSKSSLLQVLISIQGKGTAEPAGRGGGRRGCRLRGVAQVGSASPAGLVLPFPLTLLDKAVSLSPRFGQSGCRLFSCPEFWLPPSSLTQYFPFSLQELSTELVCMLL